MSDTKGKRDYHFITDNLTDGFAYMKMIFDEDGQPVDVCFHDINTAYEKQTGLKRDKVVGHSLSECMPGHGPAFLERCGRLVKTGEPLTFEQYDENTGRWYDVKVYSLHKDNEFFFFTSDITSKKEQEKKNGEERASQILEMTVIEEAMRKNENKYRMLFNSIDQGFFLIDVIFDEYDRPVDLYYAEANHAATKMLGSNFTGRRLKDIDPNYEEYWFEIFGKVALTGQSVRMEQYAEPDKKWYSFFIFRIGDEKNRRIGNIFLDITERKRMEDAIKDSEQLYRTFFESTEEGFVLVQPVFDKNGHSDDFVMLQVNQIWEKQTGLTAADFIGKSVRECLPEIEPIWPLKFASVIQTEKSVRFESYNRDTNRWYELYAFNYQEDKVGVLFRDITERKKAEEALLDSEERMRALVNSMPDEVWFADKDKMVTLVNPAVLREFGDASYGDTVEKIASSFEVYRADGSPRPVEEAPPLRALSGEIVRNQEEIVRIPARNELRYRQVSASPVIDVGGNIIGTVSIVRDITEQKQGDQALRESEKKYRTVVETSSEGIIMANPDGEFIYVNQRFADMLGYREDEILGKPGTDFSYPQEHAQVKEVRAGLHKGGLLHGEFKFRRKDGTALWTMYNATPVFNENGEHMYNFVMHTDITEKKYAEEALRESERVHAFQSAILESVRDPLWVSDPCLRVVYWNDAAAAVFGWTADEAMGQHTGELFRTLVPGSTREEAEEKARRMGDFFGECVLHCKDGSPIIIEGRCHAVRGPDGQVLRFVNTARDISSRKKLEEKLAFHAHALASMQEAICAVDENFTITFWNEMAEEIFGWTAQEAVGSPSKEIFKMISPSNREQTIDNILKNNGYTGEAIYRKKNGEEVNTSVICSIMWDAQRNYKGNVSSFRDITLRKRMEEALRESGERQAFLLKLSDALRQMDDPVQIQLTACLVLGEHIGVSRVLYGDVIDEKEVVISRDYYNGVPSIAATLHAADFSQFTIDSYKSGKPVIICDVSTDPRLNEAERSAYGSIHVAANISLGLVKNGKWVAAFGAHHNEPRNWTPLEISLMEDTAERTWAAVERAKTEETLLEKTRQLEVANCQKEDILESISDCFYVLDNDLRFTYVNKPAEEIWGLSRSELMGRKIEDIFPKIIDISLSKFHQVLLERYQQHYEVYSKVIGIWGDMGVYPMQDGLSVYFRDITGRKRLEQQQALLSEISRELVGLTTIDDTMGRLSEKIGRYFGVVWSMYAELVEGNEYSIASDGWNDDGAISLKGRYRMRDFLSDDQLARNNAGELTIVSDTQADTRVSAETYGALGIKSFIILPISRDGQWRFQMSIIDNKPRKWREDEVDLFREIAQRIWARLERARAEEELRKSESLLITIIEGISDPVYLKDAESRMILANSAVAQAQGQPLSNLIGKSDLEFFENKESGKMVLENDRRVMDSNKIQVLEETVEVPDGVKTYLSTKVPWHDADGKVIGIFGISRDITDRKNMELELKRTAEELQQADKNKNEFISVLSHELRNPLAAISAGVQILEITKDAGQTGKVIEVIKRQTNQLCKLVDDLLELTRITQNKIKLKKENINLNEIVFGSVDDIRHEFEKKDVTLQIKMQPDPVLLNADPVRINQIIGNILFNALKFTHAKGTVWVTLKTTEDDAVIRVKDNGIGISPEILPHLFSPFTQADHSLDRSTGGLGLGLSIVKGIVDLHGGKVSAFSEGLGKGSTFEIRLPLNNDEGIKKLEIMPAEKKNRSLKILLIDDNQDFTDILSSALTLLGHEVITANDGMTGIAKIRDFSPEVIFCDIGLPEMDGFEVAKRIRGEVSAQNVYMVALTGYANQSDTDKALESGFNKHLAKPIDIHIIRKLLNEVGS